MSEKVDWIEYELRTVWGALLCKVFGHSKKPYGGRCHRCLHLLDLKQQPAQGEMVNE